MTCWVAFSRVATLCGRHLCTNYNCYRGSTCEHIGSISTCAYDCGSRINLDEDDQLSEAGECGLLNNIPKSCNTVWKTSTHLGRYMSSYWDHHYMCIYDGWPICPNKGKYSFPTSLSNIPNSGTTCNNHYWKGTCDHIGIISTCAYGCHRCIDRDADWWSTCPIKKSTVCWATFLRVATPWRWSLLTCYNCYREGTLDHIRTISTCAYDCRRCINLHKDRWLSGAWDCGFLWIAWWWIKYDAGPFLIRIHRTHDRIGNIDTSKVFHWKMRKENICASISTIWIMHYKFRNCTWLMWPQFLPNL